MTAASTGAAATAAAPVTPTSSPHGESARRLPVHDGTVLVERDMERGILEDVVEDAVSGRARLLVLLGEPGVGKSHLLAEAAAVAAERGARVVPVRAVESERAIPGAAVSLIVSSLSDVVAELDQERRDVLRGTARGIVDGTLPGAVLELLARAAEARPVVLLGDDVQWWDPESFEALMFAARRLRADDIAVVVAGRTIIARSAALQGAHRVVVQPLDHPAAVALLLHAAPDMVVEVARQVVDALGGNPAALLDAAPLLPDRVRNGTAPLPDPVPVGGIVAGRWADVLNDLSTGPRAALAVLAADGSGDAGVVQTAWAAIGCDAGDLVCAEERHAVVLRPGGWEFPNAVIRSAVYSALAPPERRAAHAALATALSDCGRDALYAHHLAASRTGPDPAAADQLARLADVLAAQGSPVAAATTAEQAVRLTPPGLEYAVRLQRAADLTLLARDDERTIRLAEQGLAVAADDVTAARFRRVLGVAVGYQRDTQRGAELLRDAATVLTGSERRGALVDALAFVKMWNDPGASLDLIAELGDLDELEPWMLLDVGNVLAAAGAWPTALPLLEVGLREVDPSAPGVGETVADAWADSAAVVGLGAYANRYRDVATRLVDSGSVLRAAAGLAMEVELAYAEGRWSDAERIALSLRELDEALGRFPQFSVGTDLRIAARRGDRATFLRAEAELHHPAAQAGLELLLANAKGLRATLLVSLGEHDAAEPLLRQCLQAAPPGMLVTTVFPSVAVTLVAHLARTERADEARDVSDRVIDALAVQPSSLALAYVERLRAHCEGDDVDEHFHLASAANETGMHAFEAARTRLEHAQWLRRRRRRADAIDQLVPALAAFEKMGCVPWSARCHEELHAAGVDTTRSDPYSATALLTAQERQVADAAAEGLTNAAIARRMFLSPKTIELHLTHVYRKLAISGRSELVDLRDRVDDTTTA